MCLMTRADPGYPAWRACGALIERNGEAAVMNVVIQPEQPACLDLARIRLGCSVRVHDSRVVHAPDVTGRR